MQAVEHSLNSAQFLTGCNSLYCSKYSRKPGCKIRQRLVSNTQSAFVAERQILDGPFILNEVLDWCKRKKKKALFFKVDFAKAYDSVRWDFLLDRPLGRLLDSVRLGVLGLEAYLSNGDQFVVTSLKVPHVGEKNLPDCVGIEVLAIEEERGSWGFELFPLLIERVLLKWVGISFVKMILCGFSCFPSGSGDKIDSHEVLHRVCRLVGKIDFQALAVRVLQNGRVVRFYCLPCSVLKVFWKESSTCYMVV
ncbi:hypothetical protein Tco_1430780 [Tanacetum coccineum]